MDTKEVQKGRIYIDTESGYLMYLSPSGKITTIGFPN